MGIAGAVGLSVGAGQALVAGSHGGQRLVVGPGLGSGVGFRGAVHNEAFRDVVGRVEDYVSLYSHRLGVRREEEGVGASSTPRGGGSFVAYVGGEVRPLGGVRDGEADATGREARSESPVPVLNASRRRDDEEEAETWQAASSVSRGEDGRQEDPKDNVKAAQMRVLDVAPLAVAHPTADALTEATEEQQQQQRQFQRPQISRQRGGVGFNACQDCGNQAKKDCSNLRCRTCCRSRGFECSTHLKSTWVPASKRRERQHLEMVAAAAGQPMPKSKRARTLALAGAHNATASRTSTSTGTPPRSSDFNSSHILQQDTNFKGALPPEVRAQAVFKCVRVTGVEDGEDEYAYHATVKIGGHIFKGMLYDQGLDKGGGANVIDLQLGGRNISSSSALIEPVGIYGASGSALLGALG